ncbi:hypothetical protein EsH8_II_000092 [Colletotrichum jinshuiense]
MTRKKFNSDLAHASQEALAHISDVAKGDDDGQVNFVFSHSAMDSLLNIRLITLSIDEYPKGSAFLAYTDDDSIPSAVSELLDNLPRLTQGMTILDTLNLFSKRLSKDLISGSYCDSDVEMTDVEPEDEGDNEDYDYDDNDMTFGLNFGLTFATPTVPKAIESRNEKVKITGRLIDDLRKAKDAGFKIALLSNINKHLSSCIFALSLPVTHLGLTEDTLNAWEVKFSDHVVLLCKYDSGYPCVENFTKLTPGHPASMQFSFGKCTSFKPTLSSALTAFNPKFNNAKGNAAAEGNTNETVQDAAFSSIPMTNSIDEFMNRQLATLLNIRLEQGVSWDGATEVLEGQTKDGHLRGAIPSKNHTFKSAEDDEVQVSTAARELLNKDYVLHNPRVTGPLPQNQLSMPLIAMQFALRYFVKSTQYCLVCHRKTTDPGFTALKPYVCSKPLCLFQYMALGLGPSIEHDIIARPYVVDLLVSFCAAALEATRIREYPQGLAIKVPLWSDATPQASGVPTSISNVAGRAMAAQPGPSLNYAITVWAQISAGKFNLNSAQTQELKPGDIVMLAKPANVTVGGKMHEADIHHCRIKSIDIVRNKAGNHCGRVVEFDCIVSTHRQPNNIENANRANPDGSLPPAAEADYTPDETIDDEEGDAELYLYNHDLDDLNPVCQREALLILIQSIPPIRVLRDYLLSHKGSSLSKCERLSKSALALLRWIVSSNRSFIVQIDQPPDLNIGGIATTENREHEKFVGMSDDWMQFRFAQGSPEKENRFKEELEKQGNCPHPTLFAWHGSHLANWHSIIRTGLDFKDTLNGRAYGQGVYFSPDFSVSQWYSRECVSSWMGSELKLSAAISLCEIINRPDAFTSHEPYYVVPQVDWIQCRYLIVKRKQIPVLHQAPDAGASGLDTMVDPVTGTRQSATYTTITPESEYIIQDPFGEAKGLNQKTIKIPIASLPKWRQKSTLPGSSPSQPIILDSQAENNLDDDPDDFDLILDLQESESDDGEDTKTEVLDFDPEKMDFAPGTMDVASLPQLPPPAWASDNGRKVLGKELSKLQKLQSNTPLHQLGWYIDFENMSNMFQWIVEMHSFEKSLPLAQDMERNGVSSIVLEIRFGRQFPLSPPFVRVIRPRFLPFAQRGGGHVTAGGAMCMELLTNSGWSPVNSMESVLLQVRMAMCSLEPFPARLMERTAGHSNDYGIYEAIEAYKRSATTHGWLVPPDLDVTAYAL